MRVPRPVVPVLVALAAAAGVLGARFVERPSVVRDYASGADADGVRTTRLVVHGVRCVDTATAAALQLADVPGVKRFTAWAAGGRVEIRFDPAATDVAALIGALEGPVYDEASQEYRFGTYAVREVDGRKVDE